MGKKKKWILAGACLLIALAALCMGCKGETPRRETTPAPATTPPETTAEIPFSLTLNPQEPVVVWEDSLLLSGRANPGELLTAGGQRVEIAPDGSFSCQVPLALGKQRVEVTYQGEKTEYLVERRYAVQSFAPYGDREYHPGQTVFMEVMARRGSRVEAFFQGSSVPMKQATNQLGSGVWEGFVLYTGQVKMPEDIKEASAMGAVTYRVTCDGITEEYESGTLTCAAYAEPLTSDPAATPEGYWDVGSGYIVEMVGGSVETFSGRDANDRSDPTNNYLPAGTVDYGSIYEIHNREENRVYRALRCGVRVYAQIKNDAGGTRLNSVDCYYGTLPDHNEINLADFAVEGHHTYLTLDCLWKAPFYFDFEPQDYRNAAAREFYVENFDARYIDITFCYADRIDGTIHIGDDHPLFRSAEIIKNQSDMTLRLWLKKEGGLYGWDAYYDENDRLVFRFLNPAVVRPADNAYGADLTGVTIMLDVGHGGVDMGAAGHGKWGETYPEGERNLLLAELVKKELESTGATVILNRTDNEMQLTNQERIRLLQSAAPDYCLCLHHNSSVNPNARGHETGFFTTFSQRPSEIVAESVGVEGIYTSAVIRFYLYYLARTTTCPVVLTEGGYLSNPEDLRIILSDSANRRNARALAQGVVNYFLEINDLAVPKG